jgi:single-stranded-DNA-specific exonuclease RecJ
VSVNADTFGGVAGAGLAASAKLGSAISSTAVISASGKFWKEPDHEDNYSHLLELVENSTILAKLLVKRGFSKLEDAKAFLSPDNYTATSPMELPDVDKAIVRIVQAIAEKQHITVYGDYDVDGVTGTSVLLSVLRKLGASVDFYIPNRATEGYGLNLKAVSVLVSKHRTKLLITCDCGVSNFAEVNFAKSLGVDTLILDHHTMPEMLPPAVGIIHPKRLHCDHPLFDLPGVGVAYKVCEALLQDQNRPEEIEPLLDFVTLGMIADLVPLVRENRYLVQIGLPKLLNTPRPGLQALLKQVRKSDDTDIVGFGLAPRINAVGRLSEAKSAVELMTTDDEVVADTIAKQLQNENVKRQELCERIFKEADVMVQTKINLDTDRAIAIWAEGWHHGVVGIVASRLVEKYNRPVFIGELEVAEGVIRGSARGVDGMDLYEALKLNESLLNRWGGHKMAAGFSLEASKGDSFRSALVKTCNKLLQSTAKNPTLHIDVSITADEVTTDLARLLTKLAPFGMGNKKPLLHVKNVRCLETRELGKEGKHHRITLQSNTSDASFEAVFWNSRNRLPSVEQELHMVFTPEINAFNGRERLQLILSDWRSTTAAVVDYKPEADSTKPSRIPPVVELTRGDHSYSVGSEVRDELTVAERDGEINRGSALPSAQGLTFATRPIVSGATAGDVDSVGGAQSRSSSDTDANANVDIDLVADSNANAAANSNSGAVIDCTPPDIDESELELNELNKPSTAAAGTAGSPIAKSSAAVSSSSPRFVVKDLRNYSDPNEALQRAAAKLGSKVQIFSEVKLDVHGVEFRDRTLIDACEHLILGQYPPSEKVVQALLRQANPSVVYLLGRSEVQQEDPAGFLRRLYGLVKYAVNQKDGQVDGEKLAALMSATKMSLALGLTVLRKVNLIDWFAEEGMLFLDLVGEPVGNSEELPEFKQLAVSLKQAHDYRLWCQNTDLSDVQDHFKEALLAAD